jgi:hypothetical protein
MGDILSIADLREITGLPTHTINYALNRYGPKPTGRLGIVRIWRREDLPQIQEALQKTAAHCTHPRHVGAAS